MPQKQDPKSKMPQGSSSKPKAPKNKALAPSPPHQDLLEIKDYGWREPESYSTRYLEPLVVWACRQLRPDKALDLGCGNGSLTAVLAARCREVWGCDVDVEGLEIAARRVPDAHFKRVSVYDDPENLGTKDFDLVISCEVIEHLFIPRYLPQFAREVLKPNGHLLISTPYHGYLKNLAIALLGRWDRHHGVFDDGGHVKFFSRNTLTQLLGREGFKVKRFSGAGRLPLLWKSMVVLAQKT